MKLQYNSVVIGRTNCGKSSFLNALTEHDNLLVTPKAQTTRHNHLVKVFFNSNTYCFWDTPGFTQQKNYLERYLTKQTLSKVNEFANSLLIIMFAANKPINNNALTFLKMFDHLSNLKILVISKADLVSSQMIQEKMRVLAKNKLQYQVILPFSVFENQSNYKFNLLQTINKYATLQEMPKHYLSQSNLSIIDLVQTLVRQWLADHVYQEIPHSTCLILNPIDIDKSVLNIMGKLYCEKVNQRKILIGKQAHRIKALSTDTRIKLEKILQRKVYIHLQVVTWNNWRNDPAFFDTYGKQI